MKLRGRKLTISTTAPVVEHLRRLVATGFYGASVEDAAERLLCERLRATMPPPALPAKGNK